MGHQITLTLSDSAYETLCDWAKTRKKSVKQVAAETLQAATLSEKPVTLSEDTKARVSSDSEDTRSDDTRSDDASDRGGTSTPSRWRKVSHVRQGASPKARRALRNTGSNT